MTDESQRRESAAEKSPGSAPIANPAFRLPQFIPWLAAACLALACAWFGQLYLVTRAGNAVLREQQALAELELRGTRQQLEAERLLSHRQLADAAKPLNRLHVATLAPLSGNLPGARAVVVWDSFAQEGLLEIERMPPPAAKEDYALWLIDPSQPTPVHAAVFTVNPDGIARVPFRSATPAGAAPRFSVSRERKGDTPHQAGPQGPVVLLSE